MGAEDEGPLVTDDEDEGLTRELQSVELESDHALDRLERWLKIYNATPRWRVFKRRKAIIVIEGALLELTVAEKQRIWLERGWR